MPTLHGSGGKAAQQQLQQQPLNLYGSLLAWSHQFVTAMS
jgi:hypothetical protein